MVMPASAGTSSQGFSNLLRILEASIDLTMDPFEPTPISESSTAPQLEPLPPLDSIHPANANGDLDPIEISSTYIPDFDVSVDGMAV